MDSPDAVAKPSSAAAAAESPQVKVPLRSLHLQSVPSFFDSSTRCSPDLSLFLLI